MNIFYLFLTGLILAIPVGMLLACYRLTGTFDIYRLLRNPDYWAFAILNSRYKNDSLGGMPFGGFVKNFRSTYIARGFSFPWRLLADVDRVRLMNVFNYTTSVHFLLGKTPYTYDVHKRTMVEIDKHIPKVNHWVLNDYLLCDVKIDTVAVAAAIYRYITHNAENIRWGSLYRAIEDSGVFVPLSHDSFAQMIMKIYPSININRSTVQRGVKVYNDNNKLDCVPDVAIKSNLHAKQELEEYMRRSVL